jgi:hypothetical protein
MGEETRLELYIYVQSLMSMYCRFYIAVTLPGNVKKVEYYIIAYYDECVAAEAGPFYKVL